MNGFIWAVGLGAQEGLLYDFKKSFYKKGEDKTFYIGKKICNAEKYGQFRKDERHRSGESGRFFPAHRG